MSFLDRARGAGKAATGTVGAGAPTGAAAIAGRSRYKGLAPAEGKSPFLGAGDHVVEIVKTERIHVKSKNPWLKTEVKIVESTTLQPGAMRTIRKVLSETAIEMSGPEILSMVMALFGFGREQVPEFEDMIVETTGSFAADNGLDAEGVVSILLECVEGYPDAVALRDAEGNEVFGLNPLAGMRAKVTSTDVHDENGKHFANNYDWSPLG